MNRFLHKIQDTVRVHESSHKRLSFTKTINKSVYLLYQHVQGGLLVYQHVQGGSPAQTGDHLRGECRIFLSTAKGSFMISEVILNVIG